jgi:hypothetical protein
LVTEAGDMANIQLDVVETYQQTTMAREDKEDFIYKTTS